MTCQVSHRKTAKAWKGGAKRNMLEMDGWIEGSSASHQQRTHTACFTDCNV